MLITLMGVEQCDETVDITNGIGVISGQIRVGTHPLPAGVSESVSLVLSAVDAKGFIEKSVQVLATSKEYTMDGLSPGTYNVQVEVPRYYLLDQSESQLARLTNIYIVDGISAGHDILLWVYVPGRIHVDFRLDSTEVQRNLTLSESGCRIIWSGAGVYGTQKTVAYRLEIPTDKTELDMIEFFKAYPSVLSAIVIIEGSFPSFN